MSSSISWIRTTSTITLLTWWAECSIPTFLEIWPTITKWKPFKNSTHHTVCDRSCRTANAVKPSGLRSHRARYKQIVSQQLCGCGHHISDPQPASWVKFTNNLSTILRQFSDLRQSYVNWQIHRTFTTILRPILRQYDFTVTFYMSCEFIWIVTSPQTPTWPSSCSRCQRWASSVAAQHPAE